MIIDGFNKLTLLDYPGYTACIIFTRGCNFNCNFCQNSTLIKVDKSAGLINNEEVLEYLKKIDDVLLVTHMGVINMFYYILNDIPLDMDKEKFGVVHSSIHEMNIEKKLIRRIY